MGMQASKLLRDGGFKRLRSPSVLTPRGYIPISVGINDDTKRFMVHAKMLGDADFLELLCRSAEEYGFCNEGVLRIPLEADHFEEWMLRRSNRKVLKVQ